MLSCSSLVHHLRFPIAFVMKCVIDKSVFPTLSPSLTKTPRCLCNHSRKLFQDAKSLRLLFVNEEL